MSIHDTEAVGSLLDPANVTDPFPYYNALRERDPVHWEAGLHAWIVTRHDDVMEAFRDPRLRTDYVVALMEHQLRGRGHDPAIAADCLRISQKMMVARGGADHTRLRRQGNPAFDAKTVEGWRPAVERIMNGLLDRVQGGRMDVATDIAQPLVSTVITEVIGVPEEYRDNFLRWSNEAESFFGLAVSDLEAAARLANDRYLRLEQYILGLIEERRVRPGDDVISRLIAHEHEGHMTPEELAANVQLLVLAGNVTTIDQLENGVHVLLSHPDALARLRERPELRRSAIEEMLRYRPPLHMTGRMAAEDLEIRGTRISAGQMVFLCMAAANRDPAVFPEPDRFDIARAPGRAFTFGFGPHLCLGAGLARLELDVAFEALLRRLPGLRLDDEAPPRPKLESLMFRGFLSLPVRF